MAVSPSRATSAQPLPAGARMKAGEDEAPSQALDEVKEWRARALDAVYPVVIFDALRVKIRDNDSRIVRNKAALPGARHHRRGHPRGAGHVGRRQARVRAALRGRET
jgi:hypothetical protein